MSGQGTHEQVNLDQRRVEGGPRDGGPARASHRLYVLDSAWARTALSSTNVDQAVQLLDLGAVRHQEAWAAISKMIHEAVGLVVPPGALPSKDAINARYGPTFGGYAQALCEALAKLR